MSDREDPRSKRKHKKSEAPTAIIMRDAMTGQPVAISPSAFPLELHPEVWCENPYWRYSGLLSEADVKELFSAPEKPITPDQAKKLGRYILIYVQNIACAVWVFALYKDEYLRFILPCISRLHEVYGKCKNKEDVMEMIRICLDYGMDPF